MPGYELIFISMSRRYGWHCLVCGEYSTAGNPPETVGQARRQGAMHMNQVHGVRVSKEERFRVASYDELYSLRVFG